MNRAERRRSRESRAERKHAGARALREAIRHHRAGDLDRAEATYTARLRIDPDDPDALHYLGVLRHQTRRTDEGIALIERAVAREPGYVDAWNNLGNVCKESGRLNEAEAAYRRAIELDDRNAGAWNNLGIVLCALDRAPEAVAALRQAIERAPRVASSHYNLGGALRRCGTLGEAIGAYARALELEPENARAHQMLGRMLYLAGDHAGAASIFRSWAAVEPDNPVAAHMLAACSGENVPSRASDTYVRVTFDAFADSFDEMLLHRLDYRAPELLVGALADAMGSGLGLYDILDAGCGTGLCGALLEPYARTLVGVDLSPGMLRKARLRDVYDQLVEGELESYLAARVDAFDVVASADTLCYFGDLASVLDAARHTLRSGGLLGFTVERADDVATYRINPHGRYSHAYDYLEAALGAAGFRDVAIEPAVLRSEAGAAVNGWVVRARADR